ncbi:hypothetical protein EG328_003635 [Venturia inaequalis]|uniref:Uncharacterized protein n=1 Tax=Venturia inaequalis TaxID=5025 RepID=A0A8H3ZBN6_VENIN|nr:hypothetical protein EG328_003635 [Venturia inaequalis]KAE9993084.1 hypothetical protein EG327_006614 [Venturia inaequalis]
MKLSTTLLLCLTVNSVAAGGTYWQCYKFKGTQGYCRQYEDNHIPVPGSKQECRQRMLYCVHDLLSTDILPFQWSVSMSEQVESEKEGEDKKLELQMSLED